MQEALAAWGDPQFIGTLGGGNRNTVWEIRLGRQPPAARTSRRSPAGLEWEIGLLDHLARSGMRVPVAVPALDGRRHVQGVFVHTWLEGSPPGPGDWPAITAWERQRGHHRASTGSQAASWGHDGPDGPDAALSR
jgi:Ser/Thr protein kinase RdoA (MazF antagonist)